MTVSPPRTRKVAQWINTERPRPLYISTLSMALMLVLLLYFCFIHNGYKCFRTDHLTQIPLLYKWADPGLFPRDWFLTTNAHFDLRKFHLLLLAGGQKLFGLPVGILLSYCAIMLGTFAAWVAISRRLFLRAAPAIAAIVLAIMIRDGEIGSNHVIEDSLIPRMEAYLLAWWSFWVLLRPRRGAGDWLGGLAAGLLMAGAGYFHPAIAIQFGLALAIWLLVDSERRDWLKSFVFLAAMAIPLAGSLLRATGGLVQQSALTAAEQIQLAAYVRHPHHMIPHIWRGTWLIFIGVMILFIISWSVRRRTCSGTRSLGRLAAVIVGLLALATVFIELFPVRSLILFQPYRLAVMLYMTMFLVIGRYIMELILTGSYMERARAALIAASMQGWALVLPVAAIEALFDWRRRRGLPLNWKWMLVPMAIACIAAGSIEHDFRETGLWVLLLPAAVAFAERKRLGERPRLVCGILGGATVAGALVISAFFWMPLERWIDGDNAKLRGRAAKFAYKYQFNPIPIVSIERLGAWAAANTERDALFIVPPAREPEGFRIWSRRSVWFEIKFFPYKSSGFEEWRNRYLAVRGIPDIKDPARAADVDRVLRDNGGARILDDYRLLTPPQILALARRIVVSKYEGPGPIYFVSPTHYHNPALELVHQDADRQRARLNRNRNYLYRVHL